MFLGVRCQHVGSDLWHWHSNESWHFLKTLPQQRAAHPWSSFTMRRMCATDTQQTQTDTQWRFSVTGTIWCFKGFRACLKKFPAIISLYLIISLFSPVHSFCSLYIYIYPSAEDTLCFLMANVKLWVDRFPPPWSAAISKADLEASRREGTVISAPRWRQTTPRWGMWCGGARLSSLPSGRWHEANGSHSSPAAAAEWGETVVEALTPNSPVPPAKTSIADEVMVPKEHIVPIRAFKTADCSSLPSKYR